MGKLFIVFLLLFTLPVFADDDEDELRNAQDMSRVVSIDELMSRVQSKYEGNILKVELKSRKHASGWRYKVKILPANGNVLKLEFDAETLELLKEKGHKRESGYEDDENEDEKSFWKKLID